MPEDEDIHRLETELMAMARRRRGINRDLAKAVDPRLDPTAYPMVALLALYKPKRVSELAADLSLDKSTVSRQIDAVSRLGLVERRPDPADARARLVTLTDSGRAIVSEQLMKRRARLREQLRAWDTSEVTELARLLHKMGETGLW